MNEAIVKNSKHVIVAVIVCGTIALMPAFASEPGQPLDCSDWVFLAPGLSCTTILPFGAPNDQAYFAKGVQREADNTGSLFALRETSHDSHMPGQLQLVRFDGATETVIAYVADRNWLTWNTDGVRPVDDRFTFDRANGRFIISLINVCFSTDANHQCDVNYSGWSAIAITGFATMFDVLQTFTPQPALGFRVPYMPEGMAGADHFDTYWGHLSTVGDWSQAHPLQCNYPATAPHVGDYLTVPDTVPTPVPGRGIYYVTAATYQGATRYGRKTTARHLSGRDPAVLPACGQ